MGFVLLIQIQGVRWDSLKRAAFLTLTMTIENTFENLRYDSLGFRFTLSLITRSWSALSVEWWVGVDHKIQVIQGQDTPASDDGDDLPLKNRQSEDLFVSI